MEVAADLPRTTADEVVVGSALWPGETESLPASVSFLWPLLAMELLFHHRFLMSCFYHSEPWHPVVAWLSLCSTGTSVQNSFPPTAITSYK